MTNQSNIRNLFNDGFKDRSHDRPIPAGLDNTLSNVDRVQLLTIGMITITELKQDQSANRADSADQYLPTVSIPEKRSSADSPPPKGGGYGLEVDPKDLDLTGSGADQKIKTPRPES